MNSETFISFSVKYKVGEYKTKDGETRNKYFELRFLDSLRFMNSSLDALVKNLTDHPILGSKFEDNELLKKKGVFPYEYLDSFEKLKETELPQTWRFLYKLKTWISYRGTVQAFKESI